MLYRRGTFQEAYEKLCEDIDALINRINLQTRCIDLLDKEIHILKKKVSDLESKLGKDSSDWLVQRHKKVTEELRRNL